MKRIIVFLEICFIFTFSMYFYTFSWCINFTKSKNVEMLEKNFDKNVIDIDGEINLTEIKSIRDDSYKKFEEVFKDETDVNKLNQKISDLGDSNQLLLKSVEQLTNEVSDMNKKVDTLKEQYQSLKKRYDSIQAARSVVQGASTETPTYLIKNFPVINQYPNYPTGCESVAITLLLRYYGVSVSPDDVIKNLAKEDLPYYENNILYGGNPEVGFIGNPYSSHSYGVYEKPIKNVANIFKGGIESKENFSFNNVLNLVQQNKPVVVWTSMGLAVPYISKSWIYKPTGEKISWKAQEHAVVVIGYSDNSVIISDPIGGQIKYQSRSIFESRYRYYGERAVYVA